MTEFHKEELDLLESFLKGTINHLAHRSQLVMADEHDAEDKAAMEQKRQEISDIQRTISVAEAAVEFIHKELRPRTMKPKGKSDD